MPEITARLSTALADRYKIEHEIGAGGMATVYLAEDLRRESPCNEPPGLSDAIPRRIGVSHHLE
jgi:hypothetical protein